MIIENGQLVAIDHVITDGVTILGDGVSKPLEVIGGGSDTIIVANNGISASNVDDKWYIGLSGNKPTGNYVTSADASLANKQLVLKNNKWEEVEIPEGIATQAWVSGNFTSATTFNEFSASVTTSAENLSAAIKAIVVPTDYVSKTEYQTFSSSVVTSAANLSAAIDALDFAKQSDIDSAIEDISATIASTYVSASELSQYQKALTTEQLSAISSVSGLHNTTVERVNNDENIIYVGSAKDDKGNVTYSLSAKATQYSPTVLPQMQTLTPNLVSGCLSAVNEGLSAYVLSAAEYPSYTIPDISGYGLSAWFKDDAYNVSANIKGVNGVSAKYDADTNTWTISNDEHQAGYLYADKDNIQNFKTNDIISKAVVTKSGSKKFEINADDGAIVVPEDVSKFTICINETISENTSDTVHAFLLNGIELYYVDGETTTSISKSKNYYQTETGSSNVSISLTIDHSSHANAKYYVKYNGSNSINVNANMQLDISIIEEITSIDRSESGAITYGSDAPIYKSESNQFWLAYDGNVLEQKTIQIDGVNRLALSVKQASESQTGVVTPEQFAKIEQVVNSRVVENFPIASITDAQLQLRTEDDASSCMMHIFRPNMNFTLGLNTQATLYVTRKGDTSQEIIIGVADANKNLKWLSESVNIATEGALTIDARTNTETYELNSGDLYYMVIFGYKLGACRIAGTSIATMNDNATTLACGGQMGDKNRLSSVTLDTNISTSAYTNVTETDGRKPYISLYNKPANE